MKFCSHNCKWIQNKIHAVWKEEKPWSVLQRVENWRSAGVQILRCHYKSYTTSQPRYFPCNYQYLCDQARKAIFCAQRTTKNIEPLTPEIYFYLFDSLVRPILTYGSEVWGFCKSGLLDLESVLVIYALHIKGQSNHIKFHCDWRMWTVSPKCIVPCIIAEFLQSVVPYAEFSISKTGV